MYTCNLLWNGKSCRTAVYIMVYFIIIITVQAQVPGAQGQPLSQQL